MKLIPTSEQWIRVGAIAMGAWLVVGTGLWTLRGPSSGTALGVAVVCTLGVSALLWWFGGRFDPTSTALPLLVAIHAFTALLFGALMVSVTYSLEGAAAGVSLRDAVAGARFLGAEFVFWVWLYAVLGAGSHGLRLREAIRDERERSARSEAHLAEARLAALHGQLNPHFLFNALHAVTALVEIDPARATDALERLGDLLRYSLDDAEADTVLLRDELRFTHAYLEVVAMVAGPRLSVSERIDPDALGAEVPPFALQALVENAVRHGVLECAGEGAIMMSVALGRERVELRVENDRTCGDAREGHRGGLTNLRERLAVLYGTGALIEAEATPAGGYVARVEVPVA